MRCDVIWCDLMWSDVICGKCRGDSDRDSNHHKIIFSWYQTHQIHSILQSNSISIHPSIHPLILVLLFMSLMVLYSRMLFVVSFISLTKTQFYHTVLSARISHSNKAWWWLWGHNAAIWPMFMLLLLLFKSHHFFPNWHVRDDDDVGMMFYTTTWKWWWCDVHQRCCYWTVVTLNFL